jgi:hypothetical protein
MKRFIVFLAALFLGGCFADLDWRELHSEEGRFSAWLPARASEEARTLPGSGARMRQWSARARNSVFAVGYADFSILDQGVIDEVRNTLVANIGGRVQAQRAVRSGEAQGTEVEALGAHGGAPVALHVRLLPRGNRLYQIATVGPPGDLLPQERETFFDALKLDAPGR